MIDARPLTDSGFWDDTWEKFEPVEIVKVGFRDIYERFLQPDPEKTMLELGASYARHLVWLAKNRGYRPHGVDFSRPGLERTRELFKHNGLPEPVLFQADLFAWDPGLQFDLVYSHGFVEHFQNFPLVLQKHVDLTKPGGLIIFTMPHMAHLNYVFRWLVDRENLKAHNVAIMNLPAIRSALAPLPVELLHLSYHRTWAFPPARSDLKPGQKVAYFLIRAFGRRVRKLIGQKRPNRFISPNIVCVARKKS